MSDLTLPTKSTSINGHEYETTVLDAAAARPVFLRLAKVLGSGAAAAGGQLNRGTWAASIAGMAGSVERLSDEDFTFFVNKFGPVSTVQVEGGARLSVAHVYPMHFAGKMKEQLQWLLFCFESNFEDFFGDAKSQLAEIWDLAMANQTTKAESNSSSPKESIGGSGDSLPTNESEQP